ncbi:MAG TPA: 50S ribosomal protein L24 [Beggiatoa sp.]|nr:MAG: 50S ribosomal protein L24 [Beggiatoa sp. 4572_84]RKZ61169.1 MAG: 50S ribosomal protein L24 [Gammaproteobacteria bacterium]HEW97721.1 50S ribosomal protein L24 [Beggiatoa sp.]
MRRIKTGDEVEVIAGKDQGKRGKVIRYRSKESMVVENINLVKRHTRGNPVQGTSGGIIDKEMPIHISNVALVNPTTNKSDKVGFKFLEDGTKVRYFKSNGEVITD